VKDAFSRRWCLIICSVLGCVWAFGCDQQFPSAGSDPVSAVLGEVVEADPALPDVTQDPQSPQDPQEPDPASNPQEPQSPQEPQEPDPAGSDPDPSVQPPTDPTTPQEPQSPDPDPASPDPAEPQDPDPAAPDPGSEPDPNLQPPVEPPTAEFFVDAQEGDDNNAGIGGWGDAWRTLGRAMQSAIPGCVIYLRGTFDTSLAPIYSGTEEQPIRIVGPATIDTQGRDYALAVRGVSWYEFEDLTFQVMNESLPDGSEDEPGTKQYSIGVAILSDGASHNRLTNCSFINAGYGSNRSCLEVIWSDYNIIENCVAIAEALGDKSFGRRAYLISGGSYNEIRDCVNYGPRSPGPDGSTDTGVGVGVTIYGGIYQGSRGIQPEGTPMPCVGNVVLRHTSYDTFAYAFGFTAGYSWVEDNTFQDCMAYVSDQAYAACYANIQPQKGSDGTRCRGNAWINCTVTGGRRGFWVNAMPGCRVENCSVLGEPGITRSGYELRVDPELGLGSFTVVNSTALNVDVEFVGDIVVEP